MWGAVNLDGGELTQATFKRQDGRCELLPSNNPNRLLFSPDFTGAPPGSALMYFYVRDAGVKARRAGL